MVAPVLGRWRCLLALIGLCLLLAQPGLAQDRTASARAGPGFVPLRDERWRESFERLLLHTASRDLPRAWRLAQDLGPAAVPLLADMLQAEKQNSGRRLGVLAAMLLAAGVDDEERWAGWLDQRAALTDDRALVGLWLAMGPRRQRALPDFWPRLLGSQRPAPPLLQVTSRLAAARCPGAEVGAPLPDDELGALTAAGFAGLPVPAALEARLWQIARPERLAELFWRGQLLGTARHPALCAEGQEGASMPGLEHLLRRARELVEATNQSMAPVQSAAALLLGKARELPQAGRRLDPGLLPLWLCDRRNCAALAEWLPPAPPALAEHPGRLAVAYVLGRSPREVLAEQRAWGQDGAVRRAMVLALAWVWLDRPEGAALGTASEQLPEWFFVRWAAGQTPATVPNLTDPALAAAAVLARDGRLPRAQARELLEAALWRSGDHPGLSLREQEQLLVRDLLLLGSRPAARFLANGRRSQVYLPSGYDAGHPWFEVAVPLWELLSQARPPVPAEYRLR